MFRSVRITPYLLLALIVTSAGVAQVSQVALDVLRQSILAEGMVNFSGMRTVVVFENGAKVQGYEQAVHEKAPGKLRMAVVAPEGMRGRLCVSNGEVQWHYVPDRQRALRRELPPAELTRARRLADLDRLTQGMVIQYLGLQTIAGRSAHVVCVSTSGGSPLKKTWVDTEHFVALKTQSFDTQGRVKLSMYYTAINFQPTYTSGMFDFTPPEGCSVREESGQPDSMSLAEAEGRAGYRAALPGYLPAGYRFQSDAVSVLTMRGKQVLWLNFSNGVDTFSVFQRPRGVPLQPRQFGRTLDWSAGGFAFTLVGQLSYLEMCKVRDSVSP